MKKNTIQEKLQILEEKLSHIMLPEEIEQAKEKISAILQIKEEKNVLILGHNYMTPDVYYGLSDYYGDSLMLSYKAANSDSKIILFNGVHFMAEVAKILNPEKKVLIADMNAGCSLAESITAKDVVDMKKKHPNVPVVSYINCSAEVKAESDIICTSSNAEKIANSFPSDTVILIPDYYLAMNVQKNTDKKIIPWLGKCIVHELFSSTDVELNKRKYSDIKVIAHPECKEEVVEMADFTGSTSQIDTYIENNKPNNILLLTECSMSSNIKAKNPKVNFVSTCQTCPHMQKITLDKILDTIKNETNEILLPENIRVPAEKAIRKMLEFQ